jgi:hypothetical protein
MEPTLSDLPEELAGSTLLVGAVDDLARKFGVKLEPSLTTIYFRLWHALMLFFVVFMIGRDLAPYEASVRYPEGHFQDHSQNLVIKNFNEVVALHRKCLAIWYTVLYPIVVVTIPAVIVGIIFFVLTIFTRKP